MASFLLVTQRSSVSQKLFLFRAELSDVAQPSCILHEFSSSQRWSENNKDSENQHVVFFDKDLFFAW